MITAATSKGTCWRGVYFYLSDLQYPNNGKQLGRLVLDPSTDYGPKITIAFPVGIYRSCADIYYPKLAVIRIPLPKLKWKYPASKLYLRLYQLSQRFWFSLDGRTKGGMAK